MHVEGETGRRRALRLGVRRRGACGHTSKVARHAALAP
ncbi:hypothetical protein STRAU_2080 [Streptomyces aurantiacus JA 4570]|uniref:Uncharacterized protein n=1 Tax=Streptomyces aurantiacus JA 4570 TaxID=1286094 RepID=S4A2C1_9ACTN|nr:hypothetical protein STRAU_2080 [Streptomyces aurantiacus JA 4570]